MKHRGIDFTYEKPVAVVANGRTKIWYPDFHLNTYHILIEYLGMNVNPENARINDYKRRVYRENRFDLIEIYPSDFERDWQHMIDRGIYDTLDRRIRDYVSKGPYPPHSAKPMRAYNQRSFRLYR